MIYEVLYNSIEFDHQDGGDGPVYIIRICIDNFYQFHD